jgi:hypothetical protein
MPKNQSPNLQHITIYTEQKYKVLVPCFIPEMFHTHKKLISLKCCAHLFASVSEHFFFAKKIHPPDVWHIKKLINIESDLFSPKFSLK